ncbi:zinc finger MYM-type protein 6-like [Parasteatoda tepidariorum]|uniref:zinc finger MYM-type protein 6-like n=1 Tax=Parasteatoda tepidariorum TaxID=114398 RepID=UPI0039BC6C6E
MKTHIAQCLKNKESTTLSCADDEVNVDETELEMPSKKVKPNLFFKNKIVFVIRFGSAGGNLISHSVPLSNNTVSRRIDEMAANVESKLIKFLKEGKFELQIDESTVIDNKAVLAYVRFINESKEINEEMLFTRTLNTDTKGLSFFKLVKDYFEVKEIPLTNVSACATDGAPTMSGCHTGSP